MNIAHPLAGEPSVVGVLVVAEALDDVVPGAVGGANLDADGVPVDGDGLGGGEGLGVGSALEETTEKLGAEGEEALLGVHDSAGSVEVDEGRVDAY